MLCLVLALLFLCGCRAAPAPETTVPTTVPETTAPAASAFTGDFDSYTPRYTGRWESAWEADILFLAEKYLTEHSYLCDANFFIEYQPDLSGNNEVVYENSAFDPEKRQRFIEDVDALLASIPELTDEQIHCELLRMVAAVGDVHSNYLLNSEKMLPLFYQPFIREDGVDFRVVSVCTGSEKLLMAKLVSINGIPVAELVERVSAYVAHESDRALPFQLSGAWEISALSDWSILSAAGIIDPDAKNVKVEFETEKGISEERVAFRTVEEIISRGLTVHPMESAENIRCDATIRNYTAYGSDSLQKPFTGVLSVHSLQHGRTSALHRKMYVFAHIIPLGNRIKDIICHILRVRRGETDTHAWEFLRDYLKQLGKSGDVFIPVDEAIRIYILTQQDNLLESLFT